MREKPRETRHERGVRGCSAGIERCSRSRCSSEKRSVAKRVRRSDGGGMPRAAIVQFFVETTVYSICPPQRPSRYAPGADEPYARRSSIRWSASRAYVREPHQQAFLPPTYLLVSLKVGWPRFSRDGTPEGSQPAFAVRGCCPWEDSLSIRSTTERHSLSPSSLLRCLISVLCSSPSLAGRQRGFFVHLLDRP